MKQETQASKSEALNKGLGFPRSFQKQTARYAARLFVNHYSRTICQGRCNNHMASKKVWQKRQLGKALMLRRLGKALMLCSSINTGKLCDKRHFEGSIQFNELKN